MRPDRRLFVSLGCAALVLDAGERLHLGVTVPGEAGAPARPAPIHDPGTGRQYNGFMATSVPQAKLTFATRPHGR